MDKNLGIERQRHRGYQQAAADNAREFVTAMSKADAKCKHEVGDTCGCRCHSVDIMAHGCCNVCGDCNQRIPKALAYSHRVMAQVAAPGAGSRPQAQMTAALQGEGILMITPKQETKIWAMATDKGVSHMLLEWLEYESGLHIQVAAVSELRRDQMDAIFLALAVDGGGK